MLRCILVLFVVTAALGMLIDYSYHELHNGPCPKPAIDLSGLSDEKFTGHFFSVWANYGKVANKYECHETLAEQEGETILEKIHYRDVLTQAGVDVIAKYESVADEPGRFTEYHKNADGEYEATGWIISVIKLHGDAGLEHLCIEEGDKHFDYYKVFSKTLPVPEDTIKVLKEAYEATGDSRKTPYYFNHENCDYKYD